VQLSDAHGDVDGPPLKLRPFGRGERRDGRGQALVEFALVFPLIVLLLFGVFDLGRAVYAYNTIANAARQGARVADVNQLNPPNSNTACNENMPVENQTTPDWSIKACAAHAAVSLGLQPGNVTVTYGPPSTGPTLSCPNSPTTTSPLSVGCIATVTVTYSWTPITPVIGNIIGSIIVTSTSQIPIERVFP
jgi:Flp pilus assembly protein TadG